MPEQKVPLSPRERLMLVMLRRAIGYVAAGVSEGALERCALPGSVALLQLERFAAEVEAGGLVNGDKREAPAPAVVDHGPLFAIGDPNLCAVSDCGLSLQHGNYQSAVHAGPGREHA